METQAFLHRRHAVDRPLPGRALILVILGDVDEVGLAETTLGPRAGAHQRRH